MNHEEFVRTNVRKQLLAEGWLDSVATPAANYATAHYYTASHANHKGDIFKDCLQAAKQWAKGNSAPQERPKANRKG